MIYFIQQGDTGPVKIGVAGDVTQRLAQLQGANPEPLHVRGYVKEWDHEDEAELHAVFARYRIRGEWFEPVKALFDFIWRYTQPWGGDTDAI